MDRVKVNTWKHGRAETMRTDHANPGGPYIRHAKACCVRKLGNLIVTRAEIFLYEPTYTTEIVLVTESFRDGEWITDGVKMFSESDVDHMKVVFACEAVPCQYYQVRAYFLVNAQGIGRMQEVTLEPIDLYSTWGRSDGLNEQRFVPLDDFYDEVPLPPVEDRQFYPEEGDDDWDIEYPFSVEEEEYYASRCSD